MKNNFLLLFVVILLSSCAGTRYTDAKKQENNRITITANVKNFRVITRYNNMEITSTNNGVVSYSFPKLKKKYLKLRVESPDRDPMEFRFKRVVRRDAWWRSFGLGLFTYFTPFLIDYTNANFYKVHPKKNQIDLVLIYTEDYAHRLYVGLVERNDLEGIRRFVSDFKGYRDWSAAVDFRDKLELDLAISQRTESAIDQFINTHPNSKYIEEAKRIKQDFTLARESFAKACQLNTVAAFEAFLAQFPVSIHKIEANLKLIDAAEKSALSSSSVDSMEAYILNYLAPLSQYLVSPNGSTLESKKQTITKAINSQLQKEFLVGNTTEYLRYSKFWKRVVALKTNVAQDYLGELESLSNAKAKICKLILEKVIDNATPEKQVNMSNQINDDFPKLFPSADPANIIFSAIENAPANTEYNLKLYKSLYTDFVCNKSGDNNPLSGKGFYYYMDNGYKAFDGAEYEVLKIKNGAIIQSKVFDGKHTLFSFSSQPSLKQWEISYYQNNNVVKTLYKTETESYAYEYLKGENISLMKLEQEINKGEKELANKNYSAALDIFNNNCNNTFPKGIPLNVKLQKAINVAKAKKLEEDQRIERERKAAAAKKYPNRACKYCENDFCCEPGYKWEINYDKMLEVVNAEVNEMGLICSENCAKQFLEKHFNDLLCTKSWRCSRGFIRFDEDGKGYCSIGDGYKIRWYQLYAGNIAIERIMIEDEFTGVHTQHAGSAYIKVDDNKNYYLELRLSSGFMLIDYILRQ